MSKAKQVMRTKVAREVPDISLDQIEKLHTLFPASVSEGKVDFDKLRESLGEYVDGRPERYSFTWAGKRNSIQVLQMPTRATVIPVKGASVNFDSTENLFIEGDNLEALKLLQKPYFGRVKMIYIDPPCNTGNDFVYLDNYADPLDSYLRMSGQKDGGGKHSHQQSRNEWAVSLDLVVNDVPTTVLRTSAPFRRWSDFCRYR